MARHDILNRNQRRHFEVLFSLLEEELIRIERLATEPAASASTLTIVDDDLPPLFADRARPILAATRTLVKDLAGELRLVPRHVSRRRSINAALTTAMIRLDDSSPSELRGYGAVDPRFVTEVGPALNAIRESVAALAALLAEPSSRRSASQKETPWT
jgi:hypothetical protein